MNGVGGGGGCGRGCIGVGAIGGGGDVGGEWGGCGGESGGAMTSVSPDEAEHDSLLLSKVTPLMGIASARLLQPAASISAAASSAAVSLLTASEITTVVLAHSGTAATRKVTTPNRRSAPWCELRAMVGAKAHDLRRPSRPHPLQAPPFSSSLALVIVLACGVRWGGERGTWGAQTSAAMGVGSHEQEKERTGRAHRRTLGTHWGHTGDTLGTHWGHTGNTLARAHGSICTVMELCETPLILA